MMRVVDLGVTFCTAAATLAVAVALIGAGKQRQAQKARYQPPPPINQSLQVAGLDLSVEGPKGQLAEGSRPTARITATNPGSEPADISCSLVFAASSPRSMMSRRVELPKELWTKEVNIALAPGETRTITVEVDGDVPAAGAGQFYLRVKEKAVASVQFALGPTPAFANEDSIEYAMVEPAVEIF